jgi:hypothetical protein
MQSDARRMQNESDHAVFILECEPVIRPALESAPRFLNHSHAVGDSAELFLSMHPPVTGAIMRPLPRADPARRAIPRLRKLRSSRYESSLRNAII